MIIVDEKNRMCAEKFSDYDYKYKDQVTFRTKKMTAGLVSLSLAVAIPVSVFADTAQPTTTTQDAYGAAAFLANISEVTIGLDNDTSYAKTAGTVTINGGVINVANSTVNVSNTENASYSTSDSQYPSDYAQSDFYWRYRPFGYSNNADYSAGILTTPSLSTDLQGGAAWTFATYRQLGFAAAIYAADGSEQNVSNSTLNVYSKNGIALGVVADKVDYSSGAGGGTVTLTGDNTINVNSDGTETGDADGMESFTAVALKTNAKWNYTTFGSGTINVSGNLQINTNGAAAVTRGGNINFTDATVTSANNTDPLYFQTMGGGSITFNGSTVGNNQWVFVGGGIGGNGTDSTFDLSGLTTGSLTVGNLTGVGADAVLGDSAGDATINLGDNNLLVGGANKDGAWSGIIEGTGGSLTKTGTGTLTLSGTNTYDSGTEVDDGTLVRGSEDAILTDTALTVNGGELDLGDWDFTASQLSGTGGSVNLNAQNLTVDQTTDTAFAGSLTGSGTLTKQGSGTLALSGDSSYTGGTILSAGEIDAGSNTALGAGTLAMADGTTLGFTVDGLNLANDISLEGTSHLIKTEGANQTLSGTISGDSSFTKTGNGILSLTGENTYTGDTLLQAGTIEVSNNHALGTGDLVMSSPTTSMTVLGFSANQLDIANNIVLTDPAAGFTTAGNINTGSYDETLSGVISGNGIILKTGDGSLTLKGENTYTAGTLLYQGALNVGNNNALGSNYLLMNDSTTLGFAAADLDIANNVWLYTGNATVDTGSNNQTLSGVIYSDGGLTKSGSGTLTLSGDNTYTGGTTLSDGEIDITNGSALGTGDLSMADGTTLGFTLGDLDLTNNVDLSGGTATVDTGSNNESLSGVISGAGALAKDGSGTLTLNGENTYTGGTRLAVGEIDVANNSALGTGTLTMAADTVLGFISDKLALANDLLLSGGTATVATGSHSETLDGVISGAGQLAKNGNGTLTLSGDNSYSGGTLLNAGEIDVGSNTALGTGTLTMSSAASNQTTLGFTANNLEIANNIALADIPTSGVNAIMVVDTGSYDETLNGVISGDGTVVKRGDGTLTLNGASTYTGITGLAEGQLNVGNDTALGGSTLAMVDGTTLGFSSDNLNIANQTWLYNGTASVDTGSNNETLSGLVYGDGQLAKNGSGTLTLSGDNTYTGGTSLTEGGIDAGSNTALGSGDLTMADGTTLGFTTGDLNLANAVALTGTGTVATGSNNETLSGVVSGDGELAKAGTGTLTLSGDNTYTGGTSLSAGEIDVSNNSALGTGSLAMADGTTLGFTTGDLNLANAVSLNGTGTIATGSNNETLSGVVSGDGTLAKTGSGTLALSGTNTYTGGTTLSVGEIDVGNSSALGSGSLAMADGTSLGFTAGDLNLANAVALSGTGTIATGSNSETLSGVVSGDGTLAKTGSGTLALSGDNTYSGGTTLSAGEIDVGNNKALGSGSLAMADDTTLGFTTGDLDLTNNISLGGLNSVIATGDYSETLSGDISGAGQIVKTGSGTLTLNGDNTYSGGTTLSAGEIDAGNSNALGSGSLAMADGTTLGFTAGDLNLANTVSLSGTGTIATGSNSETLSGVVSGDGTLAKTGSGTLTLSGDNTYSGGTELSAGEVDVANNSALGTGKLTMLANTVLGFVTDKLQLANNIILNGVNTLFSTGSNTETLSGTVSGEGELTKNGSGTLVLTGDNTYSGGTSLTEGEIDVGSNSALGSGQLSMADNTTLGFVADNLTLANNIAFTGDQDPTIDTGAYTATLAGDISGAADLTKTGSGTLITTGDNNTYSGATTVAEGTLLAGSAGTFSSASAYTVDSGATLDLNSYSQTVSALNNSGLVSLSSSGSAGTTLTVNGDYTGDNGTLSLNTVLGGDDSLTDKLIISGAASGTTNVVVNNSNGSGAQTLEGIEVIETGSSTADAFVQSGRIVAGAYDYHLQQGNASGANTSDWYLTSTTTSGNTGTDTGGHTGTDTGGHTGTDTGGNTGTDTGGNTGSEVHTYRPEAGSYTANLAAANTMFSTTLHDRLGETQYTDALTGEKKVTSMWMRNLGSHNQFSMADGQNKTTANRYVLQIGGDLAQWSASGLDRFHVGVMGGYGNQHSNTHNNLTGYDSKGDIHGYSAGLYGTWYQNDADKTGLYVDSWALYNWFDNDVQGQGLASESYKSKGFTASVESGYTFHAGSYESAYGMTNDFYIQPQVQLTWLGVKANDHTESNGTLVQGAGNDNLQVRVGTRFYLKGKSAVDKNTRREFEPFIETNWIYNTKQYGTRMNGVSDYSQGSRNIGEVKAGVEAKISDRLNLWTTVSQQVGGHGYSNTQGAVGLKYMF